MKTLFRIIREAKKYYLLLIVGVIAILSHTALNLIGPRLLSQITSLVVAGLTSETLKNLIGFSFALLGIYFLRIFTRFFSNYMPHKAAWHLVEEIRIKVYATLQSFSMDFFRNSQSGDLVSRNISDTATFENLFAHLLPESITNILTLIGVTIVLFTINWKLALATCIPIPIILLSGYYFAKKVRPNFRVMQKSLGDLSSQLYDNFSGIQEIQAFGQQNQAEDKVQVKANVFTTAMLKALKVSAIFHPTVEFFVHVGNVIVVGFGGYLAYLHQIDISIIVAFMLYLSLFYAPVTGIANLIEGVQQALAGAERVLEVLDTPVGIIDRPNSIKLDNIIGNLTFDNVSFSYEEQIEILKNVSFSVEAGKMIAFVGATGVGKTTLARLINRFYDTTEGTVYIDGYDIRDIELQSLRKNIAMVLQDTFLFNGTISDNIAYANPAATAAEIEEAARIAGIYGDIMDMPSKFETETGERGIRLSGGQKQRISIARAVLRNAPVLILDEATASVDMQTEAQIQAAIAKLQGNRTIIAIAHRLSTVRNADIILVLANGKIVQQGNHNTLINEPGMYRDLYLAQDL
ncbi:MAG: ABC transporter ATP-binding protein/permease [Oscillospiraceae bacterium]|nr:ABC transporter ATP-binding protein/permease [Oscillospiraceae bacterium]